MTLFRAHLLFMLIVLSGYTAIVIANHGMGLFPVFFGAVAEFAWPGQFNLDFMFMLTLSALWVAYRHRFGVNGLLLGAGALVGGVLFLSAYLLVESVRAKGDVAALLLGAHRSTGR